MKKMMIMLVIVALVMAFASPAFAHPKGPDSMPDQSIRGLHRAAPEVPEFPQHILRGLMLRTDVGCPHDLVEEKKTV